MAGTISKFANAGDKLQGIQDKMDGLSELFENPLGDFLGGFELPGGLGDILGGLGGFQFPGLNLDLKLGGFGDCFRNLDDIINETLKQASIQLMLSIPPGVAAAALMGVVSETIEIVQEVIDEVVSLSQESLMELIIRFQNSSFLQRIFIVKKITDLYGEIICNINQLLDKILDLDPCNLLEELAGTGPPPGPAPISMPEGDMAKYPTIVDPGTSNEGLLAIKDGYCDAKFNIGQALSKSNNDDPDVPNFVQSESHNAAMTTLHHLAHSFRTQVRALGPGQGERALANIRDSQARIVREKASEWSSEALDFFNKKCEKHLLPALEEGCVQFERFDTAMTDPVAAANIPMEPLERTIVEEEASKCAPKEGEEPPAKAAPASGGTVPDGFVEQPKHVSQAPRETFTMEVPENVLDDLPKIIVIPFEAPFPGRYERIQGVTYRNEITQATQTYQELQSMLELAKRAQFVNQQRTDIGLPPSVRTTDTAQDLNNTGAGSGTATGGVTF